MTTQFVGGCGPKATPQGRSAAKVDARQQGRTGGCDTRRESEVGFNDGAPEGSTPTKVGGLVGGGAGEPVEDESWRLSSKAEPEGQAPTQVGGPAGRRGWRVEVAGASRTRQARRQSGRVGRRRKPLASRNARP